ncbi:MAG: hypothetical protein WBF66_02300 [Dehalococcoidia bacterium]
MRLGIDIDGVIGDQVRHVTRRIKRREGLSFRKRDIVQWDQPIGNSDIEQEIESAVRDPEYVLTMPLILGATGAISELSGRHQIVLVTNRPLQSDRYTLEWARRKGIKFDSFHNCRETGKGNLPVDVLVDDRLENVRDFVLTSGGLGILFSQPWNQQRAAVHDLISSGRIVAAQGWRHVKRIIISSDRDRP